MFGKHIESRAILRKLSSIELPEGIVKAGILGTAAGALYGGIGGATSGGAKASLGFGEAGSKPEDDLGRRMGKGIARGGKYGAGLGTILGGLSSLALYSNYLNKDDSYANLSQEDKKFRRNKAAYNAASTGSNVAYLTGLLTGLVK